MKRFLGVFVVFAVVAVHMPPAIGATDAFIAAFESDTTVQSAIDKLVAQGYKKRDAPHSLMVEGSCGVVGCFTTVLVVQVMQTTGANPQTHYVAATVTESPGSLNKPPEVQLVRFQRAENQ